MGAGIAQEFKALFPALKNLWHHRGMVGEVVSVVDGSWMIFNLITKPRAWDKPTYQSLRTVPGSLIRQCLELRVHHLAMPTIGCGLDKLDWT